MKRVESSELCGQPRDRDRRHGADSSDAESDFSSEPSGEGYLSGEEKDEQPSKQTEIGIGPKAVSSDKAQKPTQNSGPGLNPNRAKIPMLPFATKANSTPNSR